jgi:hypothetical protein
MAEVPTTPRHRWPIGLAVRNPVASSLRRASQTTITGIAKKDRKNTACPGGTRSDTAFMSEAMTMNTTTEASFRAMPRSGRMGGLLLP